MWACLRVTFAFTTTTTFASATIDNRQIAGLASFCQLVEKTGIFRD